MVAASARDGSAKQGGRTMPKNTRRDEETPGSNGDESTQNCPRCGVEITAISSRGPHAHFLRPCGHRVPGQTLADVQERAREHEPAQSTTRDRGHGRVLTDGGESVTWTNLIAFQRDALVTIAGLEQSDEKCYGLAIKEHLQEDYQTDINHGRIYPNLDELEAHGLIDIRRQAWDNRTNAYGLTPVGHELLEHARDQLVDATREPAQARLEGGETDD